jgi:hypothetical protein
VDAARWSLRTAAGVREGLSLPQLETLVRSGEARADDEVCRGGRWTRVDAVPYLRRLLAAPPAGAAPVRPGPGGLVLPDIPLRPGPDGRPEPDAAVVAALLGGGERRDPGRWRVLGRVLMVFAVVLLLVEGALLLNALLNPPVR